MVDMVSGEIGAGFFHPVDSYSFEFAVKTRWNSMNFELFFTKERKYSKLSFK